MEGLPADLAMQLTWSSGTYTADTIRKMMQEPILYAREHGLPLYCGEFGVYKPAPREDGMRWYNDMISILESEGVAWANWCYKGSFGIYDEKGAPDAELMDIFFQNVD